MCIHLAVHSQIKGTEIIRESPAGSLPGKAALGQHSSEDVLVSGTFLGYKRLHNSAFRNPEPEPPSMLSMTLGIFIHQKCDSSNRKDGESPTAPNSLCLLQTLDTLPQFFIFHVLKVSNLEEGELQD